MLPVILLLLSLLSIFVPVRAQFLDGNLDCETPDDDELHLGEYLFYKDCMAAVQLLGADEGCDRNGTKVIDLQPGECTTPKVAGNCGLTFCDVMNETVRNDAFPVNTIQQLLTDNQFIYSCIEYVAKNASWMANPTPEILSGWNVTFRWVNATESSTENPAGDSHALKTRNGRNKLTGTICEYDQIDGVPNATDCAAAVNTLTDYEGGQVGGVEKKGYINLRGLTCMPTMIWNSCSLTFCNDSPTVNDTDTFPAAFVQELTNETVYAKCVENGQYGTYSAKGFLNITLAATDFSLAGIVKRANDISVPEYIKLSGRDTQPDDASGKNGSYFEPQMLQDPIVRLIGNASATCNNQMRADFVGLDCREAINVLFSQNLWTNPFDFQAGQCFEGSTSNKTCTASLCSLYQDKRGSRYDTETLINTMINLHRNCSKLGKGVSWVYESTQITFT